MAPNACPATAEVRVEDSSRGDTVAGLDERCLSGVWPTAPAGQAEQPPSGPLHVCRVYARFPAGHTFVAASWGSSSLAFRTASGPLYVGFADPAPRYPSNLARNAFPWSACQTFATVALSLVESCPQMAPDVSGVADLAQGLFQGSYYCVPGSGAETPNGECEVLVFQAAVDPLMSAGPVEGQLTLFADDGGPVGVETVHQVRCFEQVSTVTAAPTSCPAEARLRVEDSTQGQVSATLDPRCQSGEWPASPGTVEVPPTSGLNICRLYAQMPEGSALLAVRFGNSSDLRFGLESGAPLYEAFEAPRHPNSLALFRLPWTACQTYITSSEQPSISCPQFAPDIASNLNLAGGVIKGSFFCTPSGSATGPERPNSDCEILIMQASSYSGRPLSGVISLFIDDGGASPAQTDHVVECFTGSQTVSPPSACSGGSLVNGTCSCGAAGRCECRQGVRCDCDNASLCICSDVSSCNGLNADVVRSPIESVSLNCGLSTDCCKVAEGLACPTPSPDTPPPTAAPTASASTASLAIACLLLLLI